MKIRNAIVGASLWVVATGVWALSLGGSRGAVVYRDIKGEVRYLLIKNKRSAHWGFPKGHIEPGETKKQTAIREVLEETGIHVRIIDGFESISKYKIQIQY